MLKNFIFIATTVAVTLGLNSDDYCNLESCKNSGGTHTLCTYTSEGPASSCGQVKSDGLTDEQKKKILALHNELRQKVASGKEERGAPGPQPGATNMQDMEWDDEIAEIAQRWADQCTNSHDSCRDVKRFAVGQNIASKSVDSGEATDSDIEYLINMWYDEVAKFNADGVSSFSFSPDTGHYTQLVWAKSNKLGCGAVVYPNNGFDNFYLVCNYGPSGNWEGEPLYETS